MNETIAKIIANGPVVTDGAWGTQLQARGLPIGAAPDPWNLEYPDRVAEVPRAYVEAGSRVILTNTFGANRVMLARHGAEGQVDAINQRGVLLSRAAGGDDVSVFASIGPSGAMLAMGEVSADDLGAAFRQQAAALADAGADALVIETMSDLDEAVVALLAAKSTGLPVVVSLVFDSGRNHDRTMMGTTPEQAAETLAGAGADVVGANCGLGAEQMLPICQRLKAATDLPIWMKPNAGMPELVDGCAVYKTTPDEFAANAAELVKAGASFIGGCCGSSPEMIRALVARVRAL